MSWSQPLIKDKMFATEKGAAVEAGKRIVLWGGMQRSVFKYLDRETNQASVLNTGNAKRRFL
jgi:hypothetical protein